MLDDVPKRDEVEAGVGELRLEEGSHLYVERVVLARELGHPLRHLDPRAFPTIFLGDREEVSGGAPHIQHPPRPREVAADRGEAAAVGPAVELGVAQIVGVAEVLRRRRAPIILEVHRPQIGGVAPRRHVHEAAFLAFDDAVRRLLEPRFVALAPAEGAGHLPQDARIGAATRGTPSAAARAFTRSTPRRWRPRGRRGRRRG